MTEYTWETIRDHAIQAFGEGLGAKLEDTIRSYFVEDPERVARTLDRIAKAHQRKPFDSPWAVVRSDLTRSTVDATVTIDASRQRLISQAKAWIANAGCYHETWHECAVELFGTGATTAPLAYLQQFEADTRQAPGRPIYDTLLKAAIVGTQTHGQEPIPDDTSAQLYSLRHDQPAHVELEAEWATRRVAAVKAEADHEAWNAKAKAHRAILTGAKTRPNSDDIDLGQ